MDRVDKWIDFYRSSNLAIRARAVAALVTFDDPRVTPLLLEAFDEYYDQGYGASIVRALQRTKDPAVVERMMRHLDHPDPFRRAGACEVLGAVGDTRATPALIACLDDPHLRVRMDAAWALAHLRDVQAIDALERRYMEHPDDDINVRHAVRAALEALGAADGLHPWFT